MVRKAEKDPTWCMSGFVRSGVNVDIHPEILA
jgi:hypothetical protein